MDFANMSLTAEPNIKNQLIILDFILEVVKEDLKTDLLSHIFYSEVDFRREINCPFPLYYDNKQGDKLLIIKEENTEVDLTKNCILVLPWRRNRLHDQIINISTNDFIYDKRNHRAYYFPYISLCYIYNGNHSIASGIVHKKGMIEAEQFDITKLFEHVHTDGQYWYNSHTNEKTGNITDFRIGIIYEIAKIKYNLETN